MVVFGCMFILLCSFVVTYTRTPPLYSCNPLTQTRETPQFVYQLCSRCAEHIIIHHSNIIAVCCLTYSFLFDLSGMLPSVCRRCTRKVDAFRLAECKCLVITHYIHASAFYVRHQSRAPVGGGGVGGHISECHDKVWSVLLSPLPFPREWRATF